jgi:hypothetical protein
MAPIHPDRARLIEAAPARGGRSRGRTEGTSPDHQQSTYDKRPRRNRAVQRERAKERAKAQRALEGEASLRESTRGASGGNDEKGLEKRDEWGNVRDYERGNERDHERGNERNRERSNNGHGEIGFKMGSSKRNRPGQSKRAKHTVEKGETFKEGGGGGRQDSKRGIEEEQGIGSSKRAKHNHVNVEAVEKQKEEAQEDEFDIDIYGDEETRAMYEPGIKILLAKT